MYYCFYKKMWKYSKYIIERQSDPGSRGSWHLPCSYQDSGSGGSNPALDLKIVEKYMQGNLFFTNTVWIALAGLHLDTMLSYSTLLFPLGHSGFLLYSLVSSTDPPSYEWNIHEHGINQKSNK